MIDVTLVQGIIVFIVATIGILVFTAATMGFYITKSRIWETVALLLVAFTLFRPGFFMDMIQPPYHETAPTAVAQALEEAPAGSQLRIVVTGPDFDTLEQKDVHLALTVPEAEGGDARLDALGLMLMADGDRMIMDEPMFGTPLSEQLSSFDFYGDEPVQITNVQAPADQLPKELMFIPALILLGLVTVLQRRRAASKREFEGEPA